MKGSDAVMAAPRRGWVPILRKKGKSPAQIEQFLDKCRQCEAQRHIASRRVAAPEAILKAAGGVITNLENEELSYSQTNFEQRGIIIASNNRKRHQLLCFQLKEIIEKYDIYPLKS